jgi:hypothetical protein
MATKTKSGEPSTSSPSQRINLTLSAEIKEIFQSIQTKGNYSHNAMITRFIDIYLKYGENKDEIYKLCDARLSGDIRESTLQTLNDFDLTDVPAIGYDLRNLRHRITVLEKQMSELLEGNVPAKSKKKNPSFEETRGVGIHADNKQSNNQPTSTNVFDNLNLTTPESTLPEHTLYDTPKNHLLPSSIKTFSNKSLDSLISYELDALAGKGVEPYTYRYYITNFTELNTAKIDGFITTFNTELKFLLEQHCGNPEMCSLFLLAGNITNLQSYLTNRYKTELGESLNVAISSITLSELLEIILKLAPYTADASFTVSAENIKKPQMAMKMCLNKQYDLIFKKQTNFITF